jgi:branched-chain amino acid transport system substrate-binding protein
MRRTTVLVVLLLPLLALLAGGCSDDDGGDDGASGTTALGPDFGPGDEPEGLVLGAVISQSGSAAAYGTSQQRGIELAADELGFGDAALIMVDDESDEQAGTLAMDSVLAANVSAVIGPTLSPVAAAADPSAQVAQVPVLAASNTTLDINAIGDHIWRVTLSESAMIPQAIAGADAEYDLTTAAIISQPSDAYSVGAADAFRAGAAANGVEVVADVTYDDGDDLAAVLTEATANGPSALFLAARSDFAASLLVSIDQLGLTQHLIGSNGFNAPEVFDAAGDAVNGLIVAAPWNAEIDNAESEAFVEAYREAYDEEPDAFAATAYASVQLAVAAAAQSDGTTAADIQAGLAELGEIDTVLGRFRFDENREPQYPAAVQIVEDGRFVLLAD